VTDTWDRKTATVVYAQRSVTVIGGGTGSFNILGGLRPYRNLRISSIVNMTDSGGDSGRLRTEHKILPPGDLRRCLVALSDESPLLCDLFNFRFEDDALRGRQLGNLLVLALTRILGSEQEAVRAIHRLLNIRGNVLPVSYDLAHLCAELADGTIVEEEANIDVPKHDPTIPIARVYLKPEPRPNPEALGALAESDAIVLAPGDLYTSILPNLLVPGVAEAVRNSNARLFYIQNLMTKRGETLGFAASRHVAEVIRYAGRCPDVVLVHAGAVPREMAARYRAEAAGPVEIDEHAIRALGVAEIRSRRLMSDASLARHDPDRTAAALVELLYEQ
jgi:uncharacterized cofD-like protein